MMIIIINDIMEFTLSRDTLITGIEIYIMMVCGDEQGIMRIITGDYHQVIQ